MDEGNLHNGHRQRLRNRFIKSGADALCKHELLELFLCHIIPRKDVKPTAKILLEQFGSISAMVNAGLDELQNVPGIGSSAAVMIKLLGTFARELNYECRSDCDLFSDPKKLRDHLCQQCGKTPDENIFLMILDKNNYLIKSLRFHGNCRHVFAEPKNVISQIIACKAANHVVVAHNHPSGNIMPSVDDFRLTAYLKRTLRQFNIELADHLIVSPRKCVSLLYGIPK